jgi:hypothetical protein
MGWGMGEDSKISSCSSYHWHTDKKENEMFLIYMETQIGLVLKSYMRKGFLRYEEMRKYLIIYEEAISDI